MDFSLHKITLNFDFWKFFLLQMRCEKNKRIVPKVMQVKYENIGKHQQRDESFFRNFPIFNQDKF